MNILDIIIIVFVFLGAYKGWKYGCFRSIISLVGSLLIFVLAFYLKDPLSSFMLDYLPFKSFGGIFKGITSFNILFYEGLAYLICIVVLFAILKIIIKLTGIVDKLIDLTIVFALPSKILGFIFGAIEHYIYIFAAVFILAQLSITASLFNESTLGNKVLSSTPLLSNITNQLYNSVSEVYEVCLKYDNTENDKKKGDYESLRVLLNYDIISPDKAKKLQEKGKLSIDNIENLLNGGNKND